MWMQLPQHEESVVQYMKDYDTSFRILEESLMITGIGVAFAKMMTEESVSRWNRHWKKCARMAHP